MVWINQVNRVLYAPMLPEMVKSWIQKCISDDERHCAQIFLNCTNPKGTIIWDHNKMMSNKYHVNLS